jgi:hypothetical protein
MNDCKVLETPQLTCRKIGLVIWKAQEPFSPMDTLSSALISGAS